MSMHDWRDSGTTPSAVSDRATLSTPMPLLSEASTLSSMASQREVVKRGLDFSQEAGFSVLLASLPYSSSVDLSKFVYSEESAYDELTWMEERRWWVVQERCENQVFAVEAHRLL